MLACNWVDRMIKNSTRHNRLVDGSPVPDVEGCNEVCLSLKPTGNASELGSFRPVPLVYGMACWAFHDSVACIHNDNGDACLSCLVFDERPELVERPRVVDVPVAFPNGCPHPYAFYVFEGNDRRGVLSCLQDLSGYDVVGIPGEPALLLGEFL